MLDAANDNRLSASKTSRMIQTEISIKLATSTSKAIT
jgi:hypothetical protein